MYMTRNINNSPITVRQSGQPIKVGSGNVNYTDPDPVTFNYSTRVRLDAPITSFVGRVPADGVSDNPGINLSTSPNRKLSCISYIGWDNTFKHIFTEPYTSSTTGTGISVSHSTIEKCDIITINNNGVSSNLYYIPSELTATTTAQRDYTIRMSFVIENEPSLDRSIFYMVAYDSNTPASYGLYITANNNTWTCSAIANGGTSTGSVCELLPNTTYIAEYTLLRANDRFVVKVYDPTGNVVGYWFEDGEWDGVVIDRLRFAQSSSLSNPDTTTVKLYNMEFLTGKPKIKISEDRCKTWKTLPDTDSSNFEDVKSIVNHIDDYGNVFIVYTKFYESTSNYNIYYDYFTDRWDGETLLNSNVTYDAENPNIVREYTEDTGVFWVYHVINGQLYYDYVEV